MSFFDAHPEFDGPQQPKFVEPGPPSACNDTADECAFCGAITDDVLLGVCSDCAETEP